MNTRSFGGGVTWRSPEPEQTSAVFAAMLQAITVTALLTLTLAVWQMSRVPFWCEVGRAILRGGRR